MIVSVYNIKGGTGKTSISLQLAKALDLVYVSNDAEGGAYEVFDDKKSFLVAEQEYQTIPIEDNCIYDFGGFRSKQNIQEIIKASNIVIVPTLTSRGDIKGTIKMLTELHSINQNVLVIINRVKPIYNSKNKYEKPELLINYFNEELEKEGLDFKNLNFTILREASIIEDATFDGVALCNLKQNKLKRYIYRNSIKDIDNIIKIIKGA